MRALQVLLGIFFLSIVAYTVVVGMAHGWDLFSVFLANILAISWSGQFNLDFSYYLLLSALWISWRHQFSPAGILLSVVAAIFGILFFAPYLLYLSVKEGGDMKKMLLGENRG